MKLSLALLALVTSSSAQYFSAGWNPGQKQPETQSQEQPTTNPSPIAEPVKITPLSLLKSFDINKILTSTPSVALFNRFGINITEKIEASLLSNIWDQRVPLISDDNYDDLVINEIMTEQEEIDRVWIIVVSVTATKTDGISKFLDNVFDSAFNESQVTGDLPHVKWGRMDYLNVTRVTTKWALWNAPSLVLVKDRGKTLRFYRPQQLRLKDDALLQFLKVDGWKSTPPWSSSYAPGGSNEYILDFFAVWLTKFYNLVVLIPRWMFIVGSGAFGSLVLGFLHKPPKPPVATQPKSNPAVSTATVAPVQSDHEPTAPQAKRTGIKQRKHKT